MQVTLNAIGCQCGPMAARQTQNNKQTCHWVFSSLEETCETLTDTTVLCEPIHPTNYAKICRIFRGGVKNLFIREGWFLEQNCNTGASVNGCELTDASHQDGHGA